MNIVFSGFKSNSGYGMATESFKRSFLLLKNYNIDYNIIGDIITYNKSKIYNIQFHIGAPNDTGPILSNYRILYFYWETNKLPDKWANNIKSYNEIWSPCDIVSESCIKSGYNGIIRKVPTPSMATKNSKKIYLKNKITSKYINDEYYKYYSIFQWQPRKGYSELLDSYFLSFKDEKVVLVLKCDLIKNQNKNDIIEYIVNKKKKHNSKLPIFLINDYLSNDNIFSLHNSMDCFILPHYGEGWGMPIHEAAIFGNPIITTKYGGVTDYLNDNMYYIDYKMHEVSGMEWNNVYNSTQLWAKPNIESIINNLKLTYNIKAKKSLGFNLFSVSNISNIIKENISDIKI